MNGAQIQVEDFALALPEIQEHLEAHWEELALNKDKIKLLPDWASYDMLYRQGLLHLVTVRVDTGLVGYILFVVRSHLHYSECVTAFEDVYYLAPEYRMKKIGADMFMMAEFTLRNRGVKQIYIHEKPHFEGGRIGPFLEHMGYGLAARLFNKWIGG